MTNRNETNELTQNSLSNDANNLEPKTKWWGNAPDHPIVAHRKEPNITFWEMPRQEPEDVHGIGMACADGFRKKYNADFQPRRIQWQEEYGFITLVLSVGLNENNSYTAIGEHQGKYFKVSVACFYDYQAVQVVLEEIDHEHFHRFSEFFDKVF